MTSLKIGNKLRRKSFHSERLPPFFVFYRLTASFSSVEDSHQNRHPKQKCLCVGELPTPFSPSASGIFLSRNTAPLFGKGCSEFRVQKRHSNRAFPPSFGAAAAVQETNCFIGHLPRTRSGRRADTPEGRRGFQGSPKTRLVCS